jgi:hypothetical protein
MLSGCKSRWQKRAGAGGVVEWVTQGCERTFWLL